MRRDRDRATVLGRRTNPAWATTGATSAARPDETHLHAADRQALHRPGRLTPCRMFSTCAALFGARGRAPLRLFRDAGRATRTPEPATIEGYNAACIERGRSGVSRQRWRGAPRSGSGLDSRSEGGARLWSRPYTPWRADRPLICGRNAVVHCFARQNCPRDRVEGRLFLQGRLTRRIERVRATREVGHASHPGGR